MTIEAGLAEKSEEKMRRSNKVIRKKKNRGKVPRRVPEVVSPIQNLYLACKDVFKGYETVPTPEDVQKLQTILDNMKPEDIGLRSDLLLLSSRILSESSPSVACSTIHICKNFALCMFFLTPSAVIPLHNHPEMTVFSKLLLGSMHIKSYDWVDPDTPNDPKLSKLRLARMKANGIFTAPCNTSVLYPTSGGNLHAFSAVTACVVLDVLGPPYSKDDGRDCTYYRDIPYTSSSSGALDKAEGSDDVDDESYGWLEEIPVPKDYRMDMIPYLGPKIVETNRR